MKAIIWSIAGSDSSGASGIQADLKTASALGIHCATITTALTSQSLAGFVGSAPTGPEIVSSQFAALSRMPRPAAIKIGMLGSLEAAAVVANFLDDSPAFVILDPVFRSTSGGELATAAVVDFARKRFLPRADLVTPNAAEIQALTGIEVRDASSMERAALSLLGLGAKRVLLKGGHVAGREAADLYLTTTGERFWLIGPKHDDVEVRGTGCALSTAIAAGLAAGFELNDALVLAKAYVSRGIRRAETCGAAPKLFAHGPWPVGAIDFPVVSKDPTVRFGCGSPGLAPDSLGFYPIVPNSNWFERLARAGARTIQLRVKSLDSVLLDREISQAVSSARVHGVQLFVNDHWQLALKHGAFGVHLGQEDLETADVEALVRGGVRLGISTHSLFELAVAQAFKPAYIALGPIFPTTCKSMRFGPQGISRLAEWRSICDAPLVAIGGLRPEHAASARAAGADSLAVLSDVLDHADPEARVREWLACFGGRQERHDDRLSQRVLSAP